MATSTKKLELISKKALLCTCSTGCVVYLYAQQRNLPCLHTGTCHVYTQEPDMSTHRNIPCLHIGTCLVYTQEPAMSTHRNLPCLHTGTCLVYTQEPALSTHRNLTCLHTGACLVYTQEPALSTHRKWYYASIALKGFQYPLTNLKQLHSNIVQRICMKAFI